MAKTQKTRKGNKATNTPKLVMRGEFATKPKAQAQAAAEARDALASRYYPLGRALKADPTLGEGWVLAMRPDGYICDDSWLCLLEKAEQLLGAVAWPSKEGNGLAYASWVNGFADADHTFEVAVSKAKKPNEARMQKGIETLLLTDLPQGIPPQTGGAEGLYAEVPGLGVLLSRDLVEVRFGKEVIETTSFLTALERQRVDYWGSEARRLAKAGAKAQAEAEAKAQAEAQAKAAAEAEAKVEQRKALLLGAFAPVIEQQLERREEERWEVAKRSHALYDSLEGVLASLEERIAHEGLEYCSSFLALCRRDGNLSPAQVQAVMARAGDDRLDQLLTTVAAVEDDCLEAVAASVSLELPWARPAALTQVGEVVELLTAEQLLDKSYSDFDEWVVLAPLTDEEREGIEAARDRAMSGASS
jgi:hypothetical protein